MPHFGIYFISQWCRPQITLRYSNDKRVIVVQVRIKLLALFESNLGKLSWNHQELVEIKKLVQEIFFFVKLKTIYEVKTVKGILHISVLLWLCWRLHCDLGICDLAWITEMSVHQLVSKCEVNDHILFSYIANETNLLRD